MAHMYITGGSGIPQPSAWRLAHELNAGWTGSLSFARFQPMTIPDTQEVRIVMKDNNPYTAPKTSPPLYLRKRRLTDQLNGGNSGEYELIDKTSAVLASGAENFDTFEDSTSVIMGAAIASRFGVNVSGIASFPIWKEDLKQTSGWPPLRRIAVVGGQQILVDANGDVIFVDNSWSLIPSPFRAAEVHWDYNPTDIFGKLYVEKNVGQGTASGEQVYDFTSAGFVNQVMTGPLTIINVVDQSSQGKVYNVTFYNAADEKCGQALFGSGIVTDPIVGDWPAVRFTAVVEPSTTTSNTEARLRLVGSPPNPPPAGIDPAIAWTYGSGRGYGQPFSESLIPSKAWADAHWQDWLIELNRGGSNQLIGSSKVLQCDVEIGQTFDHAFGIIGKTGRVERVEWSGTPNNYSTSIMAEVY